MAVVVQLVVGELELVEGDHLLHPLGALHQHWHDGDNCEHHDDHDHDSQNVHPLDGSTL